MTRRRGANGASSLLHTAMLLSESTRLREGGPPVVTGEDGLRALEAAIRITELVQADQTAR